MLFMLTTNRAIYKKQEVIGLLASSGQHGACNATGIAGYMSNWQVFTWQAHHVFPSHQLARWIVRAASATSTS